MGSELGNEAHRKRRCLTAATQNVFLRQFGTVGGKKRSDSVIVRYRQKSRCAVLEGIGRVARILATLMAGLALLDFSLIRGRRKQQHFAAVRAGADRAYQPMEKIFAEIIAKSRADALERGSLELFDEELKRSHW